MDSSSGLPASVHPVREYVVLVRRLWGRHIAGPIAALAAIVLPIIGLAIKSSATTALLLGVAPLMVAIILIWPAQYEVWREERSRREKEVGEERTKREAEELKNSKPEIQGELYHFARHGDVYKEGVGPDGTWHCDASVTCALYLCNHRPIKTTLKDIVIDGLTVDPPIQFSQPRFVKSTAATLEQGIGVVGEIAMMATLQNVRWKEVGRVDLTKLKVYAVDSFGGKHPLLVRHGETFPNP